MLRREECQYYERQLQLPEISLEKQKKLKNASVLVVGSGGLGCPALIYLATAGIGKIGIVDFDEVSFSNLHRQILFTFEDLGKKKAEVAKEKIKKINPYIEVQEYVCKIEEDNVENLVSQYQLILDCPDNYHCRYLVEKAATKQKKTIIYGSVQGFEGQIATYRVGGACYYCTFPEETINDEDTKRFKGIFPPITAVIGAMQAAEAVKEIIGVKKKKENTLIVINLLTCAMREFKIEKNEMCLICGEKHNKIDKRSM